MTEKLVTILALILLNSFSSKSQDIYSFFGDTLIINYSDRNFKRTTYSYAGDVEFNDFFYVFNLDSILSIESIIYKNTNFEYISSFILPPAGSLRPPLFVGGNYQQNSGQTLYSLDTFILSNRCPHIFGPDTASCKNYIYFDLDISLLSALNENSKKIMYKYGKKVYISKDDREINYKVRFVFKKTFDFFFRIKFNKIKLYQQ